MELLRLSLRTSNQRMPCEPISPIDTESSMLLAIPLIAIAYPVVMILVPAIIRPLVPDVVRSVLSLI